jgi:hypothetical protein
LTDYGLIVFQDGLFPDEKLSHLSLGEAETALWVEKEVVLQALRNQNVDGFLFDRALTNRICRLFVRP